MALYAPNRINRFVVNDLQRHVKHDPKVVSDNMNAGDEYCTYYFGTSGFFVVVVITIILIIIEVEK